jgi:hypothetical protein
MAETRSSTQPFRFMDLLKELRLMVYERIPRQIIHTRINFAAKGYDSRPILILVARTCSTAILRASRTIHAKSKALISSVVRDWISAQPVRAISSWLLPFDTVERIVCDIQHQLLRDRSTDDLRNMAESAFGNLLAVFTPTNV